MTCRETCAELLRTCTCTGELDLELLAPLWAQYISCALAPVRLKSTWPSQRLCGPCPAVAGSHFARENPFFFKFFGAKHFFGWRRCATATAALRRARGGLPAAAPPSPPTPAGQRRNLEWVHHDVGLDWGGRQAGGWVRSTARRGRTPTASAAGSGGPLAWRGRRGRASVERCAAVRKR